MTAPAPARSPDTVADELVALRRGVVSARAADGSQYLVAWPHSISLGHLADHQRGLLKRLAGAPAAEAGLVADGQTRDLLTRLREEGWLAVTVTSEGRPVYTLEPLRTPPPRPLPAQGLMLSRFALLQPDGDAMAVTSPRAWCDITVHDPAALAVVAAPGSAAVPPAVPAALATRLRHDLHWAGLATPAGSAEESGFNGQQWSPHELWFHERSRLGYRGYLGQGFGGTFWAKGTFPPVPARPEPFGGPPIDLAKPDLAALREADPTLTAVLEDRQTVRAFDDATPLTSAQLGEFLFRTSRVRRTWVNGGVEYTSRPYPAGGSVYELEVYPLVRDVSGLAPGLYHYDSHAHQLRLVAGGADPSVRRLLRVATHGSAANVAPHVLLLLSARVGRLMWKYQAMAYSLVLKHVGVAYQTMYCVATAMGLAPCALGSGDSVAFARATRRDPLVECAVGEFMLGTRGGS